MNDNRIVRAGLIGSGAYGTGTVAQSRRVDQLEIAAIAENDLSAARRAYELADVPEEDIVECTGRAEALRAIEAGKRVVTEDPLLLMDLPVEVIVESTGIAEAGARHALAAIEHGKHVAMVNKEADSAVGPVLKHLADRAGVVYSAADGDQPGLLIGLVRWARGVGLEIICGGKALDDELAWDQGAGTVSTRYSGSLRLGDKDTRAMEPMVVEIDPARLAARRELLRPLIGGATSSDMVELVIAANGADLAPDGEKLQAPPLYACEMPLVFCPKDRGGMLSGSGRIEAVICVRMAHEGGMGGGVFITADGGQEYSRNILRHSPVRIDGHPVSLITRPYHFLGVETIRTILAAGLEGSATGAADYLPRYDVLTRASRNLKAGERFGILRGNPRDAAGLLTISDLDAFYAPAATVRQGAPMPIHLLDEQVLAADVPAGAVITRDAVETPSKSVLWALRRQDELFLKEDGVA